MARDSVVFGYSVIVVGLVRNAEKTLVSEIKRWDRILKYFNNSEIYLVESDSKDETVIILERLKITKTNFSYISLGSIDKVLPERIERLTFCRNKYLDYIDKTESRFDYVVVADFDNINNALTPERFLSSWNSDIRWDCCFANQSKFYYDLYALRLNSFQSSDIWMDAEVVNKYFDSYYSYHIFPFSRFLRIRKETGFIEVDSAFGGVAVYKREALINKRYGFIDECGNITCEHVILNNQLRESKNKLFINSMFINTSWTEHTRKFRLIYFLLYTKLGRFLNKVATFI